MMEKTLKVEGMMCPHCEATVKKALEAIDGVSVAEADHVKGTETEFVKGFSVFFAYNFQEN